MSPETILIVIVILIFTVILNYENWFKSSIMSQLNKKTAIKPNKEKTSKDKNNDMHDRHDNIKSSSLKKVGATVGIIVGLLFTVLLVIWIVTGIKGCWNEFTRPAVTTTQCQRNQLLRFEDYPEGKIVVTLKADVYFYPKGGKVKIIPPSGNWYIDSPGVNIVRPPEYGGKYVITPADSSAWGIEIWN